MLRCFSELCSEGSTLVLELLAEPDGGYWGHGTLAKYVGGHLSEWLLVA